MPSPYVSLDSGCLALAALGLFLVTGSIGCGSAPPTVATEYLFQGPTMGTVYSVKVADRDLTAAERSEISDAIAAQLDNVNAKMSTYQEDSELSRFNSHETTEAFSFSEDVIAVLAEARRVSEETVGAFDITVGPVVNAWGFGPSKPDSIPSEAQLAELRRSVGWEGIEIDTAAGTARKGHPAAQADLSAIAKGYAVDRVSEALAELGHGNYMVEVGGEIRTAGHNAAGDPWRIAVERPAWGYTGPLRIIWLNEGALATSGDYRNFIEVDGVRLSHTIDPRTARPVRHRLASVSVLHDSCMTADALATALMVMGEDEAFRFATEHDLAVLLLIRDGGGGFTERSTPAFATFRRR